MNLQIIDEDGVWITNTSGYRMVEPEARFIFEPSCLMKIKKSAWIDSQAVLVEVADPLAKVTVTVGPEAEAEAETEAEMDFRKKPKK